MRARLFRKDRKEEKHSEGFNGGFSAFFARLSRVPAFFLGGVFTGEHRRWNVSFRFQRELLVD